MLIRVYSNEYPVQLCSLSGDHIRMSPRRLLQLALSPMTIGFTLLIAGLLAMFVPTVYHESPNLPARSVFWLGQLLLTYGIFVGLFWLFDFLARKRDCSYVMITIGFQVFCLLVTLPFAYVTTSQSPGFLVYLADLELGHFLGHLVIALVGELVFVNFVLPEQIRHQDTQRELESGKRKDSFMERGGYCAIILAKRLWQQGASALAARQNQKD